MSGKRYPAKVKRFAVELDQAGRTIEEIRAALAKRGHRPSASTVTYWVNDDARRTHNTKNRLRLYPHGRRQRKGAWWATRRRMEELRSIGLSYDAIARVVNHDFGVAINADQAQRIVTRLVGDRTARRALTPGVAQNGDRPEVGSRDSE